MIINNSNENNPTLVLHVSHTIFGGPPDGVGCAGGVGVVREALFPLPNMLLHQDARCDGSCDANGGGLCVRKGGGVTQCVGQKARIHKHTYVLLPSACSNCAMRASNSSSRACNVYIACKGSSFVVAAHLPTVMQVITSPLAHLP